MEKDEDVEIENLLPNLVVSEVKAWREWTNHNSQNLDITV